MNLLGKTTLEKYEANNRPLFTEQDLRNTLKEMNKDIGIIDGTMLYFHIEIYKYHIDKVLKTVLNNKDSSLPNADRTTTTRLAEEINLRIPSPLHIHAKVDKLEKILNHALQTGLEKDENFSIHDIKFSHFKAARKATDPWQQESPEDKPQNKFIEKLKSFRQGSDKSNKPQI